MFRVSRESTDTLTGGGGGRKPGVHGCSRDVQSIQGIHGYSDMGGGGSQASRDDPGMFRVSRESTDTLTWGGGGVGSQASMDDPGMFRVSRESTDTLTGGVGSQASMDDPGMFHILP